jgi:hypothetical protein
MLRRADAAMYEDKERRRALASSEASTDLAPATA